MKAEDLSSALKRCTQGVRPKEIPYVLLSGNIVTATDRDKTYSEQLDDLPTACASLPDLKRFSECVTGELTLKAEKNVLRVESGKDYSEIKTVPTETFPNFGEITGQEIIIPDFPNLLRYCIPAIETNETRHELVGIHLELSDKLRLTATNGYQVHRVSIDAPLGELPPVILPEETCKSVVSVMEGDCLVRSNESLVAISSGERTLTSRLIDGVFPPVEKYVKADYGDAIRVDRRAFLREVERLAPICGKGDFKHGKCIHLRTKQNALTLVASDFRSMVAATIKAECKPGTDLAFHLNYLEIGRASCRERV